MFLVASLNIYWTKVLRTNLEQGHNLFTSFIYNLNLMVRFENEIYFHIKKFLYHIDFEIRRNYNSKHITTNKAPSTNAKMNKWNFYNLIAFYRRHSDDVEIAFSINIYCHNCFDVYCVLLLPERLQQCTYYFSNNCF